MGGTNPTLGFVEAIEGGEGETYGSQVQVDRIEVEG